MGANSLIGDKLFLNDNLKKNWGHFFKNWGHFFQIGGNGGNGGKCVSGI